MLILLMFITSLSNLKTVQVHITDTPPKIDGFIEDVWQTADSAYGFSQYEPYETVTPTDQTVVYILQDLDNIYFGIRCYAHNHEPIAVLGQSEDQVGLGIDPFDSRNTAYYFMVNASGQFTEGDEGWVLDDGRSHDVTWDAVWYRASKVYDDGWEAEIKIPFKSIRYKKGLSEWGINFVRYIHDKHEWNGWIRVPQIESEMVSKYGRLTGIDPQSKGYYFELYPEGFIRYDRYTGKGAEIKPRASLNFKWDFTPQATLVATAYPDFAQIESDPYILNLSCYPGYLQERRSFFIEGHEIFRLSQMGEDEDFFTPLKIFYSRRIGKAVEGEPVPILGGLKLTNKAEDWSMGLLAAYTDSIETEPERAFGVVRLRKKLFHNSDIGILFSGSMEDIDHYNYAFGIDGVYRSGRNQSIIQAAISNRDEKIGWSMSSGFSGVVGDFLFEGGYVTISDSFDVQEIGFIPWSGMKKLDLYIGPYKNYNKGIIRELTYGPGLLLIKEPGSSDWSRLFRFYVGPEFRGNWGFDLSVGVGRYYEADTNYFRRSVDFGFWMSKIKYNLNFGLSYTYGYNYYRSYPAHSGSNWIFFYYSPMPRVGIQFNSNSWVEFDANSGVIAVTSVLTPRIHVVLTPKTNLSVFNEFVLLTPETNFGESELLSNRLGLLLSWNFSPKSWLYVAINDCREQDDGGELRQESSIGAIKVKYLIYF